MYRVSRIIVVAFVISLIVPFMVLAAGGREPTGETMRPAPLTINGANRVGSLEDQMIEQFAKYVNDRNEAGLSIQHIPGDQLGSAPMVMDQVAAGTLDMFGNELAWVAPFDEDLQILNWGFTFRDRDHMDAFFRSERFAQIMDRIRESQGLRVLAATPAQPRLIFSMKEINSLSDFRNMRVRVPEVKVWIEMKTAWGATPTPLAFGEVFLAMRTGLIEAGGGPVSAAFANNYHQVANYMVNLGHIKSTEMIVINETSYQRLNSEQRAILEEEAQRAIDWANAAAQRETEELIERMQTEGIVQYTVLERVDDFRDAMAAAATRMEAEGLWSRGLFREIQAIR